MSFGMPRSQTPVVSRTLTLFSHPGHFEHAKNLVGYAGLGAGVHDSGLKHQGKGITKAGRKELRWALVEGAWGAVRSDPYWKAQYDGFKKRGKYSNEAIVAVARRMLVSVWHILTKREPYRHFDAETIAYKMLIWSQRMDEKALKGMTRQQFAKYGLLRLGVGRRHHPHCSQRSTQTYRSYRGSSSSLTGISFA